jgi:hypothetical protein
VKHLKRFNEGKLEDIKELSEDYLVYLSDEDFIYDIRHANGQVLISLHKERPRHEQNNYEPIEFRWDDVKDRIIPFLSIIKKDYTINSVDFKIFRRDDGTDAEKYGRQMDDGWIRGSIDNSIEDIINDNIPKSRYMTMLVICIDDKVNDINNRTYKPKESSRFKKFIKKFL